MVYADYNNRYERRAFKNYEDALRMAAFIIADSIFRFVKDAHENTSLSHVITHLMNGEYGTALNLWNEAVSAWGDDWAIRIYTLIVQNELDARVDPAATLLRQRDRVAGGLYANPIELEALDANR
jgi:hypothetical protein